MPWSLKVNENPLFIDAQYSGVITSIDLEQSVKAGLKTANEANTLTFIVDLRNITTAHSLMDLLKVISQLPVSQKGHHFKEAIIVENIEHLNADIRFYETACQNRGFNVKIFTEHDEALKWINL